MYLFVNVCLDPFISITKVSHFFSIVNFIVSFITIYDFSFKSLGERVTTQKLKISFTPIRKADSEKR